MTEQKKENVYKILLLGDSSVGKTCFLKRYLDDTYQDINLSTIGFDFKYKYVTLKSGKELKIQLWDTAGQERFQTISKNYYKGAQGILLIYDVTNIKSFQNIKKWVNQIKDKASSKICIVLVANKVDVENRIVSIDDGDDLASALGLKKFESSAKLDINVSESFQELVEEVNKNYSGEIIGGTKLKKFKKKEEKKCC